MGTFNADGGTAVPAFLQTNVVSAILGSAPTTDQELHSLRGLSPSAPSPFWTSNQGTQTATLFAVTAGNGVTKAAPAGTNGNIAIPPAGVSGPTGQVANTNTSSFPVSVVSGGNGAAAHILFSHFTGRISA